MRVLFVALVLLLSACKKEAETPDAGRPDAGAAPTARTDAPERKTVLGRWLITLDPETQRTADLARRALSEAPDGGDGTLTFDERAFVDALRDGGTEEARALLEDIEKSEIELTPDTLIIRAGGTEDRIRYEVVEAGNGRVRLRIRPPDLPEEQIVFTVHGPDRISMGDTADDPSAVMLERVR